MKRVLGWRVPSGSAQSSKSPLFASPIDALSRFIACGAHAVTARPELAAGLATDPLTRAAMAQFDPPVEASFQPFLTD
jgi:hypothetical protein